MAKVKRQERAKEEDSGSGSTFTKRLLRMKENFEKAKQAVQEGGGAFERLPDGVYTAILSDAQLGESQTSNRLQVTWSWTIAEGEQKGETVYDYSGLDTEEQMGWFLRRVSQLGYDIEAVEAKTLEAELLPQIVEDKLLCEIQLRTKGEFQNVRVRKVLEEASAAPATKEEKNEKEKPTEEEGTTVELKSGDKVLVEFPEGDKEGVFKGMADDGEKARVLLKGDKKVTTLPLERVFLLEEEEK
jgi:hypothetical protein